MIFDFVGFFLFISRIPGHGTGTATTDGARSTDHGGAHRTPRALQKQLCSAHLYNVPLQSHSQAIAVSYRAYKAANERVWCCAQSKG